MFLLARCWHAGIATELQLLRGGVNVGGRVEDLEIFVGGFEVFDAISFPNEGDNEGESD